MAKAIKFTNAHGDVRFQPETRDGRREYTMKWGLPYDEAEWKRKRPRGGMVSPLEEPQLYRTAKKALRVAERQETWEAWQRSNEFKEDK